MKSRQIDRVIIVLREKVISIPNFILRYFSMRGELSTNHTMLPSNTHFCVCVCVCHRFLVHIACVATSDAQLPVSICLLSPRLNKLTDWTHLGDAGHIRFVLELGDIVIDVLHLDDKL